MEAKTTCGARNYTIEIEGQRFDFVAEIRYSFCTMSKQSQQLVLIFVIGILAGVAITKFGMGETPADMSGEQVPKRASTTAMMMESTKGEQMRSASTFPLSPSVPKNIRAQLSVADQVASANVFIASVKVDVPTWVAIYEEQSGVPGSILGAKKVHMGDAATVVPLLRIEGLRTGRTYFAVLLPDNGDGLFDRSSDTPPLSPEKVVMVSFVAL